jgi:ankyrin repeat protein
MVFGFFGGAKKRAAELYEAAQKGDLDGVRQALDKGADINALDPECSETALHAAVDKSQKEVVELLLSKGANPDIVSGQHFTPLIIAAAMGDAALPMVESLLAGRANPDLAPTTGPNAGGAPMHIAASKGANAILSRLLAAGAKPKVLPNGSTLLHMAAIGGNAETVEIVSKTGFSVDCTDSQARTPLHLTAITGNSAVARKLLELGAPVDKRDGEDCTPLMHAALQNKPNVVDLLLKKGANPDIVAKTGDSVMSPLYGAAINGLDPIVKLLLAAGVPADKKIGQFPTAADMAKQAGHESTVALLKEAAKQRKAAAGAVRLQEKLIKAFKDCDGTEIRNASKDKAFAFLDPAIQLMTHAVLGNKKNVEGLIQKGIDLNGKTAGVFEGATALIGAIDGDAGEIVGLLLSKGADPNAAGADGVTPLMTAVIGQKEDLVKLLLEKGALPGTAGPGGVTPLILAAARGNQDIVDRLIAAGADINAVMSSGEPFFSNPRGGDFGIGALGVAIDSKNMNLALDLLTRGCNPEFGSMETDIPLTVAKWGTVELAKALESREKSIVMDRQLFLLGAPPIEMHLRNMLAKIAFWAAYNEDSGMLDYVLDKGADPTKDNDMGMAPLILASVSNHPKTVKRLLDAGVDINALDSDGDSALSLAIEMKNEQVVKLLREKHAQTIDYPGLSKEATMLAAANDGALGTVIDMWNEGISLNIEDELGNTPLILASKAGHGGTVRALYRLGASISHRNAEGDAAWDLAKAADRRNILISLEEFGALSRSDRGNLGPMVGFITGRYSRPFKDESIYA